MDIHPTTRNKSNLFQELTQASAFEISRRITELRSDFAPGQQEDPSEFFIVLWNHMMQCISSNDITSLSTYLSNPLHSILGINTKSSIICANCDNTTTKYNYECIWSIPISSYYNLKDALNAYCSKEKLTNDNSLQCDQCHQKAGALRFFKIVNISPILVIQLHRFMYDSNKKRTRKLKHFI